MRPVTRANKTFYQTKETQTKYLGLITSIDSWEILRDDIATKSSMKRQLHLQLINRPAEETSIWKSTLKQMDIDWYICVYAELPLGAYPPHNYLFRQIPRLLGMVWYIHAAQYAVFNLTSNDWCGIFCDVHALSLQLQAISRLQAHDMRSGYRPNDQIVWRDIVIIHLQMRLLQKFCLATLEDMGIYALCNLSDAAIAFTNNGTA
jgi:hypothetical protein